MYGIARIVAPTARRASPTARRHRRARGGTARPFSRVGYLRLRLLRRSRRFFEPIFLRRRGLAIHILEYSAVRSLSCNYCRTRRMGANIYLYTIGPRLSPVNPAGCRLACEIRGLYQPVQLLHDIAKFAVVEAVSHIQELLAELGDLLADRLI